MIYKNNLINNGSKYKFINIWNFIVRTLHNNNKRNYYHYINKYMPNYSDKKVLSYIKKSIIWCDDADFSVKIDVISSLTITLPSALRCNVTYSSSVAEFFKLVRPIIGPDVMITISRYLSLNFSNKTSIERLLIEAINKSEAYSLNEIRILRKNGIRLGHNSRFIDYYLKKRNKVKISSRLLKNIEAKRSLDAYLGQTGIKNRLFFENFFQKCGLPCIKFRSLASVREKFPAVFSLASNHLYQNEGSDLVTVIMAAFNADETIDYAIRSILQQTYTNIELIIVIDGQHNKTLKRAQYWQNKDSRISLIINDYHGGVSYCRNIAMIQARGRWITFHDADDWAHPCRISEHIKATKGSGIIASISSQVRIDAEGECKIRPNGRFIHMNTSSIFFDKELVINRIGYHYVIKSGADEEYIHRIYRTFGQLSVKRIKKVLAFALWRPNSLTGSSSSGNENGLSINSRLPFYCAWNELHEVGKIAYVKPDTPGPIVDEIALLLQNNFILQRNFSPANKYQIFDQTTTFYEHCEKFLNNKNWQLLRVASEALLRLDPANKRAWRWLGQSHSHLKQWNQTLTRTHYLHPKMLDESWLRNNSKYGRITLARAQALWATGAVNEAINLAFKLAKALPTQLHIRTAMLWNLLIVNSGEVASPHFSNACKLALKYIEENNFLNNHQFCHTLIEASLISNVDVNAESIISQHLELKPELYFALANRSNSNIDWCKHINNYFRTENIAQISLNSSENPRFFDLSCSNTSTVDGPLVTVMMSAYNVEEYIKTSINSVLSQTWRNIELIIVEDRGSDHTWDIIMEMASSDPRIKAIRNEVNSGTYASRNRAAQMANGTYLTCNDSDDWSHPERIERQMSAILSGENIVATFSHMVRVTDNGYFPLRAAGRYSRHNASSILFHKDTVLEKIGFWDSVRVGADSEYISRLNTVFGKEAVITLPEILMLCNHRATSLSRDPDVGVNANGISDARSKYRNAYTEWHLTFTKGVDPYVSILDSFSVRPFQAPLEIQVNKNEK